MNNINIRPPLSPMSVAGSDWSGISGYKSPTETGSTMSRGVSSSGPSLGRSSNTSPPSSIARSSDGMRMYEDSPNSRPRMPPPPRRDTNKPDDEAQIARQHAALKALLEPYLSVDKNSVKANKARDKLLRLTRVQFQELSTDVYDELQRRQGTGDRLSSTSTVSKVGPLPDLPDGTSPFLPPKTEFHPKRNQARQKLSTLPTARFRDLATDVFYELERRYPQFTGGSISRGGSPASSISNGPGRPIPAPLNSNGMPRPNGGLGVPGTPTGLGPNGSNGNSLGRPLPKTFQPNGPPNRLHSNDDTDDADDDDDEDAFGLEDRFRQSQGLRKGLTGRDSLNSNTSSTRNMPTNDADKKLISDYQAQVSSLQKKLDQLEMSTKDKDREIDRLKDAEQIWKDDEEELKSVQNQLRALQGHNENALQHKTRELSDLKNSLENKLADAQNLNSSMQSELARLRSENESLEDWQNSHVCRGGGEMGDSDLQRKYNELLQIHDNLKSELRDQQQTTDDVRKQAMAFLNEMKAMSANGGSSGQSHEQMLSELNSLRDEVKDWKARYTKTKTQLRNLRAASIGLQYATETSINKATAHSDPNGLIKDIYITKLQLVVDEILRTARIDPKATLPHMKTVAAIVKAITKSVEASNPPDDVLRMSMKVTGTGHNLITAIRNHAMGDGLSPVSLVDAATSHLTAAVVDMAKRVKVRPTPTEELESEEMSLAEGDDDFDAELLSVPLRTTKSPMVNGFSPARTSIESVYSTSSLSSRYSNQRGSARNQSGTWGAKREGKFSAVNPLGINSLPKFEVQEEKSDVEELKNFLLSQTNGVIESIQRLLQEIRSDDSQLRSLRALMDDVIMVVSKVIQSTEDAMDSAQTSMLRNRVGPIVKSLEDSMSGMLSMKVEDLENQGPASKDFNSRLAGHCFAMARETKELVRVVEEIDNEQN